MKIRRYYQKGIKYPYYVSDEEHKELSEKDPEKLDLIDNAESDILLTPDEQIAWFGDCILRLQKDIRWYLDNLDSISSFQVSWNNYGTAYMKRKCFYCGREYKFKTTNKCRCGKDRFKIVHYGVGYLR